MMRQLRMPWAIRVLVGRRLSLAEEFLEMLSAEAEPFVADWARATRERVRETSDLALEIERLEGSGGRVAQLLGRVVREDWVEFGGRPLPHQAHVGLELPLPLN